MWMLLPSPTGTLSWPGLAFASAISSVTLFTGTLGCVVSRYGENVMVVTGVRSRMISNGSLVYRLGLIDRLPISISTSVWPSGAERTTISTPILPLAPGRESTITGWPHDSVNFAPTRRPRMSEVLPGGFGDTMRIGLAGHVCACAQAAMSSMTAHPVVRAAPKQIFEFIGLLLRALLRVKTGMTFPR